MYKMLIARWATITILSLTATLGSVWAGSRYLQNSAKEQSLTGIVSDSICKVQNYPNHHKGVTRFSCTLECVHHEGADYVLVVNDSVYILDGDRTEQTNLREAAQRSEDMLTATECR